MSIKMTVVDIICYVDYDSAFKFKLFLNFDKIQYGRHMWSPVIFETKSEAEIWIA